MLRYTGDPADLEGESYNSVFDLIVLGLHCWGDHARSESMRRWCRVYRLSPDGELRWAFPEAGAMPLG